MNNWEQKKAHQKKKIKKIVGRTQSETYRSVKGITIPWNDDVLTSSILNECNLFCSG